VRTRREAESQSEDEGYRAKRAEAEARLNAELRAAEDVCAQKMATATATRDAAWETMASDWRTATADLADTVRVLRGGAMRHFPSWEDAGRDDRPLPEFVPPGVRYGDLLVEPQTLPEGPPADERLALPSELPGPVPAFLPFPDRCSVVLKARDAGRAEAV